MRVNYTSGSMTAPDDPTATQRLDGDRMKDANKRAQGEVSMNWSTYDGDVSKRCIFTDNGPNEEDIAFFNNWLDGQVKERRETLRKQI